MLELVRLAALAGALTLTLAPANAEDTPRAGSAAASTIRLYAAGSLRAAMTHIGRAFEATRPAGSIEVVTEFGASGLLRERIEAGEAAHVFASADVGHPAKLAAAGRAASAPRVFTRNALCAIARDGLAVDTASLVDVMLEPTTRVGMSTPKADPSGDYALQVFAAVDKARPGAGRALEAKALRLTGGPASPKAPDGRQLYGWVMSSGQADVFLTYCTNAVQARADTPALRTIALPAHLAVSADYGMVVLDTAPAGAADLAAFIMSADGQKILADFGFAGAPDR